LFRQLLADGGLLRRSAWVKVEDSSCRRDHTEMRLTDTKFRRCRGVDEGPNEHLFAVQERPLLCHRRPRWTRSGKGDVRTRVPGAPTAHPIPRSRARAGGVQCLPLRNNARPRRALRLPLSPSAILCNYATVLGCALVGEASVGRVAKEDKQKNVMPRFRPLTAASMASPSSSSRLPISTRSLRVFLKSCASPTFRWRHLL
jgi:hypothetical protein